MNKEQNKPEKKISVGAISATIWNNEGNNKNGEKVNFKTITLQRVYQDKEGKWSNTNSLRITDLPKAVLVLQKSYEYLVLKDNNNLDVENIDVEELY
jgi:hypothetical protein